MSPFAKTAFDPALLAQQQGAAGADKAAAAVKRGSAASLSNAGLSNAGAAKAAQEFEAMFIAQMLKPMFQSLSTEGMFGGGKGEEMYRSLLVEEYGKTIAKAGGVGIADQVKAEMLKLQEVK
jgi:Rod binding domain-containing protein